MMAPVSRNFQRIFPDMAEKLNARGLKKEK
jgi:hypothetical protein